MKWRKNEGRNESRIECEEHQKKETEERELPIFRYNEKIFPPQIIRYLEIYLKKFIHVITYRIREIHRPVSNNYY